MKLSKEIIIFLIITIILLISAGFGYWYIYGNDYVLKVNGQKITMPEFNTYLKLQKKSMEQELGENVWDILIEDAPAIESARNSAKESLIDTKVKLQEAKKMKISLTTDEKAKIRTAVETYGQSLMDAYDLTLEELVNINEEIAVISKLEIALYKQTDHSTHEHGKIDTDKFEAGEETGTTYDSRHILFLTQNKSDEEVKAIREKAQAVLNRIKNGEDFATLATEFSEDTGSQANGGLYTGTALGSFVSEYENAALSLEAGQVYPELVKTSYGYHIIKLEGINRSEYLSKSEAQTILTQELNEKAKEWVQNAVVEINEQQYNSAQ